MSKQVFCRIFLSFYFELLSKFITDFNLSTNSFHFLCPSFSRFKLDIGEASLQNSSKQTEQVVQYKGYYYKKYIGRAYHSYWICIKSPCSGKIRISELKGGSVELVHKHDKCDTFVQGNWIWMEFLFHFLNWRIAVTV